MNKRLMEILESHIPKDRTLGDCEHRHRLSQAHNQIIELFAPPKITEEELREALPQQEDYEKSQEDKVRNITLDDCFNSISALLKKKGILAQKEG